MKKVIYIIMLFLILSLLFTNIFAKELIYRSTRSEDSKWAFVGGSSCCDCICDSEGNLPNDFPATEVHSVTFYLLGSRSSSYYENVQTGVTELRLILGDSQATAETRELSSEIDDPVKHKWYVTFTFDPPVSVGPGTEWKLTDGDEDWKTAAIAHTSDEPSGGLPGKYITEGCQYARSEDHWYSVKFDFAATEPVPSQGLKIVKKGPYEFSVLLNRELIYTSHAADLEIHKSYKNIGELNVDVLYEYSGGNICQAFTYRIVSWRPDGKHNVSKEFGNCKGPKISLEGDRLIFTFESYTMRHSGKTAPAETWEFENGELKQVILPVTHPRPILQNPRSEALVPQGNNPDCPDGYIWNFSWTIPDPQSVKYYQIRITRPWLKDPIMEEIVEQQNFAYRSCTPIDDQDLGRWRWQVRAFYQDEKWSEWSDGYDFNVAPLEPKNSL